MSEQAKKTDWYLEAAKEIVQDLVGGTPVDQAILDSEHNRTVAILKKYFATKENVVRMLTMHCGQPVQCKKCGRSQWFLRMAKTGSMNPMTDNALSHYVDCPHAQEFRKKS